VLALVASASVLTALGPVALKLIVDRFTHAANGAAVLPLALIGLYVLSQWSARVIGQIWSLTYARAERRMFRMLSERLFSHLMRLPLRFHLERQTGAVSQSLDNGLQGYQMIMHHLVFTFLPVAADLGTVILVLGRLAQPPFMALFCGALVCYTAAFAYATASTTRAAKAASAAHVEANAVMTDCIFNYETVKCFTAEPILQQKVSEGFVAYGS